MFKTLNHLVLVAATSATLVMPLTTSDVKAASVLLYNGNLSPTTGVEGLANGFSTGDTNTNGDQIVYESFTVPSTQDWIVNSIYSNNLMSFMTSAATWEIRSGVSPGVGGNLVQSGISVPATQVATGRSATVNNTSGQPFAEYTIQVSGLNITLTPGSYALGIAPVGTGTGQSFISPTSGTGNSYFTNNSAGYNFQSVSGFGYTQTNFSLGITGTIAPPTAVPFEFSPTGGIVIFGIWVAINKLKPGKRK